VYIFSVGGAQVTSSENYSLLRTPEMSHVQNGAKYPPYFQ